MATSRKQTLLELFNQKARLAKTLGMRLEFDERDRAIITMPYNPGVDHALGGTHGGIIATLLDNAGWFSSAIAHEGQGWVVTTEMSFHLLRPAIQTDLRARGELLKTGKRLDVAEMRCWDAEHNLVAHGTGTFVYLAHLPLEDRRKP